MKMQRARSFLSTALAALLLSTVALAQPARADSDGNDGKSKSKIHIRETVTWTMTTARCSSLKADLTGIGQRSMQVATRDLGGGFTERITRDKVSGDAIDINGKHHFAYTVYVTEIINPQGVVNVVIDDTFRVNFRGGEKLNVEIESTWTYTQPDPILTFGPDFRFIRLVGDPACDPI